jgi:hypothetical protein
MKIYTPEKCKEWIKYKPDYDGINRLQFSPIEDGKDYPLFNVNLVDFNRKQFIHNPERIQNIINNLCERFPQLNKILDNVSIYFCPYPAMSYPNAEVWNDKHLVLYSRTTQIPSCMTEYIIPHEFGHIVQGALCDDRRDNDSWREYLRLRNAPFGLNKDVYIRYDEETEKSIYGDKEDYLCLYNSPKDWDLKPTEWFAEDFRHFFGNINSWELTTIPEPDEKVREFILSLNN